MNQSIKAELIDHISEFEGRDKNHFTMFNEDYYIIGHYQAAQWLKRHDIRELEAIAICYEYEFDHFGEFQTKFVDEGNCDGFDYKVVNTEKIVNNLVYWYGWDLCNDLQLPFDNE